MIIFLCGAGLFALFLVAHVIVWKFRLPKRHTPALLGIFFMALPLCFPLALIQGFSLIEILHALLLYITLSLCYVITYSAIEGDSPTLSLMRFVAEQPTQGRTLQEIESFFAERPFIRARISALLHSSLVRQENGRYFIQGSPSLPFRMILGFRKIYGEIPKGG
jgi:hypothetical protein